MDSLDMFRKLAEYNRKFNESVYEVCGRLSEEERRRDMRAFFGSIHATLNHILVADTIWIGRLNGRPVTITSLDQELHADFASLARARKLTDEDLEQTVANLRPEDIDGSINYKSIFANKESTSRRGRILMHVFNHQTHHRGQVTTLLSQLGHDVGVTDFIALVDPW